jgi:hypothetical protein
MYSGRRAWIISEETSISSETKPRAQTLRGISARLWRRRECGTLFMGDLGVAPISL